MRLPPDVGVVLLTDGLVEAGRSDIDTGLGRLAGALAGCVGLPVGRLCDRLLDAIVPGPADDDVALLDVRWPSPWRRAQGPGRAAGKVVAVPLIQRGRGTRPGEAPATVDPRRRGSKGANSVPRGSTARRGEDEEVVVA